ncbi:T-complex protein 1 subunit theta, putative [Entamoeba invadens IP1]|uniref:T-complex protein 1 subunit theta, putative n=1 Tax=Entamoeba invadens IP1 TaxID=370355 RepID=UPI0002C3F0B1|nr:T-complex protein 1 subunit theta, putative [Entamoeba invadens IP1]ELP90624.1 T-complex protein 1 subunit theta, putative [Entamoeba invadens IP1]|eukprot:XP_004257395.1 T-complex protein 1 subunit theta, putative [Entamoeba invadens IP1]
MVDLLKEGTKNLSGLEEAVLKNVEAVRTLSQMTKTTYGPQGMRKLIVNSRGKQYVTSDAAKIIGELEFNHPAANMVIMAAKQQQVEVGDFTNLVIMFAGELMTQAEGLLRMGLHPTIIVDGYRAGLKYFVEHTDDFAIERLAGDASNQLVEKYMKSVLFSKVPGYADFFTHLVVEACSKTVRGGSFDVDNVRTIKILGGSVDESEIVNGFVLQTEPAGSVLSATNTKVAIYVQGFELPKTETKGTVLLKDADQFKNFSTGEEQLMKGYVDQLKTAGVGLIICGGNVSDLALHYCDRAGIVVLRVPSTFDLKRICRVTGSTPFISLTSECDSGKYGNCEKVYVKEVGSTKCTILERSENSAVTTIVVRGSTQNVLDDIEQALDDGICEYKVFERNKKFVAGAGGFEIEMSKKLSEYGDSIKGLTQYSVKKFAEAFQMVPRVLAENSGLDATEVLSELFVAHQNNPNMAVNVESETQLIDAKQDMVLDNLEAKKNAFILATNVSITILLVDQIVMQKPAGGPKMPSQRMSGPMDQNDAGF